MLNSMKHDELVKWRREPAERFIRNQAQLAALARNNREARQRVWASYVLGAAVVALFAISLVVG